MQVSKNNRSIDYHRARLHHPAVRFSLRCRTDAISRELSRLFPKGLERLLDVGCADGLLAAGVIRSMPNIRYVYGLDTDEELLSYNQFQSIQADCCHMPFDDSSFDAVVAAAVIEHVTSIDNFLQECFRLLKPGGALLATTPVPFFEKVAAKIGYLKDSGHTGRYDLRDMRRHCEKAGLKIIASRRFMFFPVQVPGYKPIEILLERLGFSFMMLNQIIVAARPHDV